MEGGGEIPKGTESLRRKVTDNIRNRFFNRSEGQLSEGLSEEYRSLGNLYKELDKKIPSSNLNTYEHNLDGLQIPKQKEFDPKTGVRNVQKVLEHYFQDPLERQKILHESETFIEKLSNNIGASDNKRHSWNTVPLGQIDTFVTSFPQNMISRLGDKATPETIVRILQLGETMVTSHMEGLDEFGKKLYENRPLGTTALLVGETIPQVLAKSGEKSDEVLAKFEKLAASLKLYDFKDMIINYRDRRDLSPYSKILLEKMDSAISQLYDKGTSLPNAFNQDREPWQPKRIKRAPLWTDLGDMIQVSEEDNREYGLGISASEQEDSPPTLDFIKGIAHAIKNGRRSSSSVFFHSHPGATPEREFQSQLVSHGDIEAQHMSDGGGGYLNVVYARGITLHIGGEELSIEGNAEDENNEKEYYRWTVESGSMKGTKIAPKGATGQTEKILEHVTDLGSPYIYSIVSSFDNFKYYFVQIPWEQLDPQVSLEDLCFGKGLTKLLSKIEGVPESVQAYNLYDAMRNSEDILHRIMDKRIMEEYPPDR